MWMRDFIFWLSTKKAVTNPIARTGMRLGFARRFIAGETLEEGLDVAAELNQKGLAVSMNRLGEDVSRHAEAEEAHASYEEILRLLRERHLDGNISIKPTQLGLKFDPALCQELVERLVRRAAEFNNMVEVDMEDSATTEPTLNLFEAVRRKHDNIGLAIQSYLYRSARDLERLRPLRPKIRLVKGAYREPPSLAFPHKAQVDENYRKLLTYLFESGFFLAIATHDAAMIEFAKQVVARDGSDASRFEFQMILGVRRDLQAALSGQGYRLRVYVPYGSEWLPYFMRRLAERPANVGFVLKGVLLER
ncbi:MAG: proline dehydrogenase family protein [Acidobacteria bacterium]|nr:proline dehydrogenase family protein [Acidobacteriota bacterium]